MAMPTGDILRIRIGGRVPSDTWSIGFDYVLTGLSSTPTPSQMNGAANALLGGFNNIVWSAVAGPLKAQCSSGTDLSSARSYLYRGGLLVGGGSAALTPVVGAGGAVQPNYVARCVTTLTDQPGRSRRGRFYLPFTGASPSPTTGLYPVGTQFVANLASIFNTSSGSQSPGYFFGGTATAQYSVLSVTHGYATQITSLRMDNKPDTQHGREDKLVATVFDTVSIT